MRTLRKQLSDLKEEIEDCGVGESVDNFVAGNLDEINSVLNSIDDVLETVDDIEDYNNEIGYIIEDLEECVYTKDLAQDLREHSDKIKKQLY